MRVHHAEDERQVVVALRLDERDQVRIPVEPDRLADGKAVGREGLHALGDGALLRQRAEEAAARRRQKSRDERRQQR